MRPYLPDDFDPYNEKHLMMLPEDERAYVIEHRGDWDWHLTPQEQYLYLMGLNNAIWGN
jgi:hypothetical protein